MLQLALIAASVSGLCLSAVLLLARHDAVLVDEQGRPTTGRAEWYEQRVPQVASAEEILA
jgi:hypothetical protein